MSYTNNTYSNKLKLSTSCNEPIFYSLKRTCSTFLIVNIIVIHNFPHLLFHMISILETLLIGSYLSSIHYLSHHIKTYKTVLSAILISSAFLVFLFTKRWAFLCIENVYSLNFDNYSSSEKSIILYEIFAIWIICK